VGNHNQLFIKRFFQIFPEVADSTKNNRSGGRPKIKEPNAIAA
jgi:hypothetical protein